MDGWLWKTFIFQVLLKHSQLIHTVVLPVKREIRFKNFFSKMREAEESVSPTETKSLGGWDSTEEIMKYLSSLQSWYETLIVVQVMSRRSSWQCNRLVIPLRATYKLL